MSFLILLVISAFYFFSDSRSFSPTSSGDYSFSKRHPFSSVISPNSCHEVVPTMRQGSCNLHLPRFPPAAEASLFFFAQSQHRMSVAVLQTLLFGVPWLAAGANDLFRVPYYASLPSDPITAGMGEPTPLLVSKGLSGERQLRM